MEEKTREFIGIAASIAGHCRPCFLYHFQQAKKLGISKDDINEVVEFTQSISAAGEKGTYEFISKTMKGKKEDVE